MKGSISLILLAIMGVGLFIGGGVLGSAIIKTRSNISPTTAINTPTSTHTPTLIPTEIPTPSITPKPTINPYFIKRIEEIDTRIAEIQKNMENAKKMYEEGVNRLSLSNTVEGENPIYRINALNSLRDDYNEFLKTRQTELNTLNAEKTQIMLRM